MVVVRWMVMSRAVCANFDFGPSDGACILVCYRFTGPLTVTQGHCDTAVNHIVAVHARTTSSLTSSITSDTCLVRPQSRHPLHAQLELASQASAAIQPTRHTCTLVHCATSPPNHDESG